MIFSLSTILPLTSFYFALTNEAQSFIHGPSSRKLLKHTLLHTVTIDASSFYSPSIREASAELLSLVVNRWNGDTNSDEKINRIETLIQVLINSGVSFDPDKCLTGPFYASVYTTGPPPLWERIGGFSPLRGRRNIQGQQYSKGGANGEGTVVNYAELYGRALHIRAEGTFARKTFPTSKENNDATPSSSPLLPRLFESPTKKSSRLTKCPVDWTAVVKKACISLLGNDVVKIPIDGIGTLRVLYADPKLRIFISMGNTDSAGQTDDRWERAGLTVVQVRIDQIDPAWEDI